VSPHRNLCLPVHGANISALILETNRPRRRTIPIENRLPFGFQLRRAQYAYRLALDRALEPTRVTTPQFAVLALLETTPGLSNAELARRNLITPQTMNAIIRNLEDAQLVVRRPDLHHGRILTAHLTPAGQAVLTRCIELANAVEARMLRPLNAHERARLLDYLGRVGDALTSLCAEG
jgi:DNA-binding MarR family transcriptional regulator